MTLSTFTRNVFFASTAVVAVAPTAAWAQTRSFNVARQAAASGVARLARQADAQILISAEDAAKRRTNRVIGVYSTEEALRLLVEGTGLVVQQTGPNAYSVTARIKLVSGDELRDDQAGVPEVIVEGRRNWSLNTGIARTRDDTQPFVVFTAQDIKQSGTTNLEQFLSNYLPSNSSAGTAEQAGAGFAGRAGLSSVDLRGLSSRETLILIDGRRQPSPNTGSGFFEQPVLTNIPLASIERIEVLASSAAGIYGAGASGGVINVILRRDYRARELTLTYADTTDFHARDFRADLVVGQSLENGRTNISFSGSYRSAEPLLAIERRNLVEDPQRLLLANNPRGFGAPPLGLTANYRSSNLQPLRLDPVYGGQLLTTFFGSVPLGYRGVGLDGVNPLLAGVGTYNFTLPDVVGSEGQGGRIPLVYGTEQIGGTLAVRREMTDWLRVYAEAGWTRYNSTSTLNLAGGTFTLPANAPNNPFQQQLLVSVPIYGYERDVRSRNDQLRLLGGAIAKLPYDWQAVIDVSYNKNLFSRLTAPTNLTDASRTALTNGTFDILRDTSGISYPLSINQATFPKEGSRSTERDISFKLAGKLPLTLPGGKATLALTAEQTRQHFGPTFGFTNTATLGQITYSPPRSETIDSVFGEIRIPLLGDQHHLPFVEEFEVLIAARHERYKGVGSGLLYPCFTAPGGFPPGNIAVDACNPASITFPLIKIVNSHTDPTFSARWKVARDLTVRASYASGYLPPRLNDLIRTPYDFLLVQATDPQRGGEPIGLQLGGGVGLSSGFIGGNPDLENESSKTFTAGVILTPRFLEGLRFSADYLHLRKKGNIANPQALLVSGGTAQGQQAFETFLSLFPDRFVRGPASGGFAVGPITSIDASNINLGGRLVEAVDFALSYTHPLFGGRLDVQSDATYSIKSALQLYPGGPFTDFSGVIATTGESDPVSFGTGTLRWRGVGSVKWSTDTISIGWRGRYFDGYFLNVARTVSLNNGTDRIPSQFYQDIFGTWQINKGLAMRAGVNNFLNKKPPFVSGNYSRYGDPRLANFYLSLTKAF